MLRDERRTATAFLDWCCGGPWSKTTIASVVRGRKKACKAETQTNKRAKTLAALRGTDLEGVMRKLQYNPMDLQFASEENRGNREIVLFALRQSGLALKYANEDLKKDPDIVTAAIQKNGTALQYAAENLKGDLKIVTCAVKKHRQALEFASERLQMDGDLRSISLGLPPLSAIQLELIPPSLLY